MGSNSDIYNPIFPAPTWEEDSQTRDWSPSPCSCPRQHFGLLEQTRNRCVSPPSLIFLCPALQMESPSLCFLLWTKRFEGGNPAGPMKRWPWKTQATPKRSREGAEVSPSLSLIPPLLTTRIQAVIQPQLNLRTWAELPKGLRRAEDGDQGGCFRNRFQGHFPPALDA